VLLYKNGPEDGKKYPKGKCKKKNNSLKKNRKKQNEMIIYQTNEGLTRR
jgi:hypothetical protein